MEDVERFIKIVQQKRLANQRELDSLVAEPSEYRKLMKELRDLRSKLNGLFLIGCNCSATENDIYMHKPSHCS